jgi:hypothetical protein
LRVVDFRVKEDGVYFTQEGGQLRVGGLPVPAADKVFNNGLVIFKKRPVFAYKGGGGEFTITFVFSLHLAFYFFITFLDPAFRLLPLRA